MTLRELMTECISPYRDVTIVLPETEFRLTPDDGREIKGLSIMFLIFLNERILDREVEVIEPDNDRIKVWVGDPRNYTKIRLERVTYDDDDA